MLSYNFERMFKARGIERPFTYLRKAGFSDRFASKIKQGNVRRLDLEEIERLCILFRCTPNDLYEWTPNPDNQIDENHPLNEIRKTDKILNITQTLNAVPLRHLALIERLINDTLKGLNPEQKA
ncbi:MAG: helix-turn-helix transcriptional regulator [Tenuifilaceae bacterium]|jgi:DNA-binding Xre family transcriptional regulator|nr:helix-turn-helix transcriptional regulator [Tenuifilaceae bacterium]